MVGSHSTAKSGHPSGDGTLGLDHIVGSILMKEKERDDFATLEQAF